MKDWLATKSAAILDHLLPPDPGALRAIAALRVTLAALLTLLELMALEALWPVPTSDRILGFAVALFAGASIRDATLRQRAVTTGLALIAVIAAVLAATLAPRHDEAAAWLLPVLVLAATYGATRGPRGAALGSVALIGYLVSLVAHEPADALPVRLLALCLAMLNVAIIRFVALPERPEAELRRLRRAIAIAVAGIADVITGAARRNGWTGGERARLRRDVERLGDIMTMAQARIRDIGANQAGLQGLGPQLLATQLAVERVARLSLVGLGPGSDRKALGDAFASLGAALAAGEAPPAVADASRLGEALTILSGVLREPPGDDALPAPVSPTHSPDSRWVPAIQAAAAVGLAIVVSHALLPTRWYWAAFAALAMFQGTRSQGESIVKELQFVAGTLCGAVAGVFIGTLLAQHQWLAVAVILVAAFFAFRAFTIAYDVMIFWITIIIALLFGMLGYLVPELLLLRLGETAVGAACGIAVAAIFPVKTSRAAREAAMMEFLRALRRLVDSATRALLDRSTEPGLPIEISEIQLRLRDLQAAARPELLGPELFGRRSPYRQILVLEICAVWARELARTTLNRVTATDPILIDETFSAAARIEATLTELIGDVDDANRDARCVGEHEEGQRLATCAGPAGHPLRLLLRIDAALRHLKRNWRRDRHRVRVSEFMNRGGS